MQAKQGRVRVTTEIKTKRNKTREETEEQHPEVVKGKVFSNVGYSLGVTKGLPDYCSVRVDVSCHLPCSPGKEDAAFNKARKFVMERMDEEIEKTTAEVGEML